VTPPDSYSVASHFGGVTDWHQSRGYRELDTIMSDSEDSTVTYTTVVAAFHALPPPDYVYGREEPEQAPPSPVYIPYVPELVYPEYIPPKDDVFPAEEQPLPAAASPTAESPGCIPESDLDEDPEEDDDDEEEEPFGDDVDEEDEEQDEYNDDEEEEHPASADSIPHPPALRILAMPIPPPSPLTPLSSPLPQIPSPPLPASPPILPIPLPATSPPLQLLSSGRKEDRAEVTLPPRKRLSIVYCPGYEAGESSVAAAARPIEGRRADYGFVNFVEAKIRQRRAKDIGYDTIMSDSEDSTVTYTTVSSPYEGRSGDVSPGENGPPVMPEDPYAYVVAAFQALPSPDYVHGPEEPEQAPPSPVYIPYVLEPEYPEYIPPEDEVFPTEEQPLPTAASPTTDSPGYIPERSPLEIYANEEDEEQDEDDDDEEEENPASADSIPPPTALRAGESSAAAAARPIEGRRADYGFVDSIEAEFKRRIVEDIGYGIRYTWIDPRDVAEEEALTTLEGVNTRVTELTAVQEQDTQDIYEVIEDTQGRQTKIFHRGHLATALGEIQALQTREQARTGAPESAGSST
nr:hypothetical protein [Tanacetum cinerariifolium]